MFTSVVKMGSYSSTAVVSLSSSVLIEGVTLISRVRSFENTTGSKAASFGVSGAVGSNLLPCSLGSYAFPTFFMANYVKFYCLPFF